MGYRRGWVCVFLFALVTINFIDRAALSVAAKQVSAEFGLSPVQMGYLFSAFLWTYLIALLPIGVLVDRYSTKLLNSVGIAVWSLATLAMAGSWNLMSLLVARLVLGASEATAIPAGGRIIREWMPARERGMATTFLGSASYAGPALGALIVGTVSSAYGWRAAFVVVGSFGFIWLAAYLVWFGRPEQVAWLSEGERAKIIAERGATTVELDRPGKARAMLDLLRGPTLWGIIIAHGCIIYGQYLLLFWLPSYLQDTKHLTIMKTGLFTGLCYAASVPLSIGLGILSDRVLSPAGILSGRRRIAVIWSMLGSAVILLVPFTDDLWVIITLITLSLVGLSTSLSLNSTLVNDLLHDPRDIGKAIGLKTFGGNLLGMPAPIITGYVVAYFGSYNWAFLICGVVLIFGAAASLLMTRQPINRASEPETRVGEGARHPAATNIAVDPVDFG
jgi:MFS family permease